MVDFTNVHTHLGADHVSSLTMHFTVCFDWLVNSPIVSALLQGEVKKPPRVRKINLWGQAVKQIVGKKKKDSYAVQFLIIIIFILQIFANYIIL